MDNVNNKLKILLRTQGKYITCQDSLNFIFYTDLLVYSRGKDKIKVNLSTLGFLIQTIS